MTYAFESCKGDYGMYLFSRPDSYWWYPVNLPQLNVGYMDYIAPKIDSWYGVNDRYGIAGKIAAEAWMSRLEKYQSLFQQIWRCDNRYKSWPYISTEIVTHMIY